MTTLLAPRVAAVHSVPRSVVTAFAWTEARRILRSPWLLAGAVLTVLLFRTWWQPPVWNGQQYGAWLLVPSGWFVASSLVVCGSFHRERRAVGGDALPADESYRAPARLLAAVPLVVVTVVLVAGLAAYQWLIGGVDLGTEPGRTLHAQPTLAELSQPVAVSVLAVAAGAALGRRLRHRVTAMLVLLVCWFPVAVTSWAFEAPAVAPFSLIQSSVVYVDVGPPATDPLTFPETWLLEPPVEYRDHWARLVVSESLSWWHTGWLLGLSALLIAIALPRCRARRVVAATGLVVAVGCVAAQFAVYPS